MEKTLFSIGIISVIILLLSGVSYADQLVASGISNQRKVCWSPDGEKIAYPVESGSIFDTRVVNTNGSNDHLFLANAAPYHWGCGYFYCVRQNIPNVLLYFSRVKESGGLPVPGTEETITNVGQEHVQAWGGSLSPDCSRIAYTSTPFTGWFDVVVINTDGTGWHIIEPSGNNAGHVHWQDNSRIIYHKGYDWNRPQTIYRYNIDTNIKETLITNLNYNLETTISPDGHWLVASMYDGSDFALWKMDLSDPSPDSTWQVLYDDPNANEIFNTATVAGGHGECRFTDNDTMLFASNVQGDYDIYAISVSTGNITETIVAGPDNEFDPIVSSGGRIAYIKDSGIQCDLWVVDGRKPDRPKYEEVPDKGQDNLVVVVHGRTDSPTEEHLWVNKMRDKIDLRLDDSEWQVHAYKWIDEARKPVWEVLEAAEIQGRKVGYDIAAQGRSHVHFIAHSAGAALVEKASRIIKESENSRHTVIHCTFLDAFTGLFGEKRKEYGVNSNWADNYFTMDLLTLYTTQGRLPKAHNVDVTWIDPWFPICSHSWPHMFYKQTIPPKDIPPEHVECVGDYGFPLSMEAGGWDPGAYPIGKKPKVLCGLFSGPHAKFGMREDPPIDFATTPYVTSDTGMVDVTGTGFSLLTGSPVWISALIPITESVNLLKFEADFTSDLGAEGLLTVYWDEQRIGRIDDRYVLDGMQEYMFELPDTYDPGSYALAFRLDAYTEVPSSVLVDNVLTAYGYIELINTCPLAYAGEDQTVYAGISGFAELTLDGSESFDPDGDELTYLWSWIVEGNVFTATGVMPTVELPFGERVIMLVVNDGIEDSESDEVMVTVLDDTPPEFSLSVTPTMLWPPNHKMVLITPTWTVTDNCDPSPEVSLKSITMNEGDETDAFDPLFDNTQGDGNTLDDIQVDPDGLIYLRAERSGTGNGRIYTITYQAVDDSGNIAVRSATVTVQHDQR